LGLITVFQHKWGSDMRLIYGIALFLIIACHSQKQMTQAEICAKLYPCVTSSDTIITHDTITNILPPQYIIKTETVKIPCNGKDTVFYEKIDTIYQIPTEKVIYKTVIKTLLDSARVEYLKQRNKDFELQITALQSQLNDNKTTINTIKGNKRIWIISTIAEGLMLLLIAAFAYYVYKHNFLNK
jgi:hypothetical protein